MGNTHIYYKLALQSFAHALVYMEDPKLAKELYEEASEERLEALILQKKEQMDEKLFYYDAGRASQYVIEEVDRDGCESFNASIGGIGEFERLIGIK